MKHFTRLSRYLIITAIISTSYSQTMNVNKKDGSTETFKLSDIQNITFSIEEMDALTDIDGNVYQIVKIGNQWWMAENLKVTHYRNGDAIPNVTANSAWASLSAGAFCNYNNDVNQVAIYGRLYNWYTVVDSRKLAPDGWHVPDDGDWQTLIDYLGGSSVAGSKMKEAGTAHWNSPNTGATNESGFAALPGGKRTREGDYIEKSSYAHFWSATENNSTASIFRYLRYDISGVERGATYKLCGYSIRCVKN